MLKIIKYLKGSIVPILIIVALLVGQAMCDLALPAYTSDIVNVGISKNGIEEKVPKIIRASEFESMKIILSDAGVKLFEENYRLISKDTITKDEYLKYKKKYPIIEEEGFYELNKISNKKEDSLFNELSSAMLFRMLMESASGSDSYGNISGLLGSDNTTKEDSPFDMNDIKNKIDAMPDMLKEQASAVYIKAEYKEIGLNVDKNQTNYIFITGAKMLGIALLSMGFSIGVGFIGSRIAALFGKNVRSDVYKKVLSFGTGEIKQFSTASLITRSTNDVQQVQQLIVFALRMIVYAPIVAIGAIIKVMNTNVSMTWIIALAVFCILSVVITLFGVAVPKFNIVQKLVDKLNLVTREILSGIPVIRAFGNEKKEEERFEKANKDLTKVNMFVDRIMSSMMPAMMLIMNGVTLLIVWNSAKGIDNALFGLGDMMAFIQYAMQIIMSFLMISMISIILPRSIVSIKRISEILNTKNAIEEPIKPKKFDENKKGTVEFKNVEFKYPDADESLLENISFKVKPNTTTAFIGSTGSGKSTLVNLIPRFYDVTKGQILVDGVNIKDVSTHDLRSKIGYIPQKGVLFSGTIESNIKYGNIDLTDSDMEKSAKIAQSTDFIEEKENKYKSEISQGGTNVSGGQKQRISIARAIAVKPEIFIFDDSFSALDFKTDAALRKALKEEIKDATVLIVAQRVSTIMNADQIVVLENGKIVGIGTHKELLKNCEVYKEIASSQLSKEELEDE